MTAAADDRLPIFVLTGFLGSGKTTLLREMLSCESFGETAVLVNEFGEIGIDHRVLDSVAPDTVLLKSGCVCCTIRGELSEAVRDLLSRRTRGELPPFRRIVLETTGLADPALIASTLVADPVLRHHVRHAATLTVVDARNAAEQRWREPVWIQQVSAADQLFLSKTDLVDADCRETLEQSLRQLNPVARFVAPGTAWSGEHNPLAVDAVSDGSTHDTFRAMRPVAAARDGGHLDGIDAVTLCFTEPLDWTAFGIWLSLLLNAHGRDVLRVKCLLNVSGHDTPLALDGVQHTIYPPRLLPKWPDDRRDSHIVLIVRGLARDDIAASLQRFLTTLSAPESSF